MAAPFAAGLRHPASRPNSRSSARFDAVTRPSSGNAMRCRGTRRAGLRAVWRKLAAERTAYCASRAATAPELLKFRSHLLGFALR